MKYLIEKIAIAIAIVVLMGIPVSAEGIQGSLWLQHKCGSYIYDHTDAWLTDSCILGYEEIDLLIANHDQKDTVKILYFITSVDVNPNTHTVNVKINNEAVEAGDWQQLTDNKLTVPTVPNFEYPSHGVLQPGVWYYIKRIDVDPDLPPKGGETILPIDVSGNSGVKIHFDAVGANDDHPVNFVPGSKDGTSIPEFPTVALPIAAAIGLVFLFQNRKKREE